MNSTDGQTERDWNR